MDENQTLVERIVRYVQDGDERKAEALAQVADYLEECYLWDVSFEGPVA